MDSPDALIAQLDNLRAGISAGDAAARKEALQLSRKLTSTLEDPSNVAVDLVFWPMLRVATRIAVDLRLFELVATHGPVDSTKLSSLSGGEELLIVRVLRVMASTGYVKEVDERTWEPTPITKVMATEEVPAGLRAIELVIKAGSKAPEYLKKFGYQCPTEPTNGFMQYAHQTKLNIFGLMASKPDILRDFNLFMGNTMGARAYWVDWFPVEERLLAGADADPDAPLLVDVGGGKGHDLLAFHAKFPGCRGRLVLQDLEVVINDLPGLDPAIEPMAYDFFTEQPVKGARAYFFHHILHDWSDPVCLSMLEQVKKAMKPGYSKLLIHEMLVPDRGAPLFNGLLDMTMMCFNAGMERSERQWRELLGRAGLRVVRFWAPPLDGADGIVEVELDA